MQKPDLKTEKLSHDDTLELISFATDNLTMAVEKYLSPQGIKRMEGLHLNAIFAGKSAKQIAQIIFVENENRREEQHRIKLSYSNNDGIEQITTIPVPYEASVEEIKEYQAKIFKTMAGFFQTRPVHLTDMALIERDATRPSTYHGHDDKSTLINALRLNGSRFDSVQIKDKTPKNNANIS